VEHGLLLLGEAFEFDDLLDELPPEDLQ